MASSYLIYVVGHRGLMPAEMPEHRWERWGGTNRIACKLGVGLPFG